MRESSKLVGQVDSEGAGSGAKEQVMALPDDVQAAELILPDDPRATGR
ncbi:hypothetical protein [Amycolatopsis rubida]|uniref:Uncharacterized protein n=1 Tax=Amycolatopsis rubida TaxID=112413 RepID=A0A1I6ABR2_9PSEU|nr:hypothetical protein [Amycolatopsis rubida]SFQ66164.1 hypothetical protein SAMN05421854_11870 [Amycolatopsis rubida]